MIGLNPALNIYENIESYLALEVIAEILIRMNEVKPLLEVSKETL